MPTYEYQCGKCRAQYELRQGFDADTTHTCEECGNGIAKRILHAPRVVFKGSGWYATDSRKSQSAVTDSSDAGAGSPPAAAAAEKPAAKETRKPAVADSGSGTEAAAAG